MPSPSATEIWSLRSLSPGSAATRAWHVAYATSDIDAINAVAIIGTIVGARHPSDPNLAIRTGGITAESPGFSLWIVKAQYSIGSYDSPPDKTQERPRYQWDQGYASEPTDVDVDGNTIINTAGDPIDSYTDFGTLFLTVTRWQTGYNVSQAVQYQNTVNNDTVQTPLSQGTLAPGQLKCLTIKPTQDYDASATIIQVAYSFEARKGHVQDSDGLWDGFKHRIRNEGRRGWYDDGNGPKAGEIFDGRGLQVSTDVLLDKQGKPYLTAAGYTVASTTPAPAPFTIDDKLLEDTGSAVFLKYRKCKSLPFSALNLF